MEDEERKESLFDNDEEEDDDEEEEEEEEEEGVREGKVDDDSQASRAVPGQTTSLSTVPTTVAPLGYDAVEEQPGLERKLRAYRKCLETKGCNAKDRLVIPWNVEICCDTGASGPMNEALPKYGIVPPELERLGVNTPTWRLWVREWYSEIVPYADVTYSSVAVVVSFFFGIVPGIICLCCCPLHKCSRVHIRTVQWIKKINDFVEPKGGLARFQTFVGRAGPGGTGPHEEFNVLVFALSPTEAKRLALEPTRIHRHSNCCCACCDSCCAYWDNHVPANSGRAY